MIGNGYSKLGGELSGWADEWAACADRRASAARKHAIYAEEHMPLILQTIRARLQNDAQVTAYVSRFASRSPNLLRSIVNTLAVVYSRNMVREVVGLGDAKAKTFAAIVAETGLAAKGNGLNARAWLSPVLLAPYIDKRGRVALDMIPSSRYTARLTGEYVEEALWTVGGAYVRLDPEGWTYYDGRGDRTGFAPHQVGSTPAVHCCAVDTSEDPWATHAHDGLADATLDVNYLHAFGRWVRSVNSTKMTWIRMSAETAQASAGQSISHPALPVVFQGEQGEIEVGMLDRIVPASDNLSEIAAVIAQACADDGLPPGMVQMQTSASEWGTLSVSLGGDRLGLLRDKQVPHLKRAEMDLWPMICDLVRGSTHRHSKALPSGDEVRDALRLDFPDLASPADIKARVEALEAGLPHGLTNAVSFAMAARPERSRAECEAEVAENLVAYAARNKFLASHNAPADASHAGASLAEQQGREGGQLSGIVRAAAAQETES